MAHRYFRTKREAERATRKFIFLYGGMATTIEYESLSGLWVVIVGMISQAEMDDILSKPMRRKRQ